jgi:hypothetical protein
MDLVMRRLALVVSLGCAACADESRPPPAGSAFHPGFPEDATSAAIDASSAETAADAPEDLARDIASIDADSSCSAFCACMSTTCATEKSYPFPDVPACESWCSKRSDRERSCFAQFCTEAKTVGSAGVKTHDCEHATGAWGLAECP